jgi:hypothetical protein
MVVLAICAKRNADSDLSGTEKEQILLLFKQALRYQPQVVLQGFNLPQCKPLAHNLYQLMPQLNVPMNPSRQVCHLVKVQDLKHYLILDSKRQI